MWDMGYFKPDRTITSEIMVELAPAARLHRSMNRHSKQTVWSNCTEISNSFIGQLSAAGYYILPLGRLGGWALSGTTADKILF